MLTAVQAATMLGISVLHVDRLTDAGLLSRHGRPTGRRLFRLSELEQVDAGAPCPSPPRARRRLGTGTAGRTPRPRPPSAEWRLSLHEAARIVGLSESTLRRHYFGTPDLPRLPGAHYVVAARDADELARRYANRFTVAQAATRVGATQEEIRQLLRDGLLPRIPDRRRPVRVDDLAQLLATGWQFGDPAHRGRIPTLQPPSGSACRRPNLLDCARAGRLPAVRDRRGHWWFRPEHLDTIQRARRSEERGQLVGANKNSSMRMTLQTQMICRRCCASLRRNRGAARSPRRPG